MEASAPPACSWAASPSPEADVNDWRKVLASAAPGDFGIIGDPVEHSLSPSMQEPAFSWLWKEKDLAGAPPRYHRFRVPAPEVRAFLAEMRKKKLGGVNVTVPHKETVFMELWKVSGRGTIDDSAGIAQATNTLKLSDGELTEHNTDGIGFERAINHDLKFDFASALVLGAGGTAGTIVQALTEMSVSSPIHLWNRSVDRAKALLDRMPRPGVNFVPAEKLASVCRSVDLVVNATSVGLNEGDGLPSPNLAFRSGQLAFDVVYHRETEFLKDARKAGAAACGGLPMLLHQGAAAFTIWMRSPAPVELMKDALLKAAQAKGMKPVWPSDI